MPATGTVSSLSSLTAPLALQYLDRLARPIPTLTAETGVQIVSRSYLAHMVTERDPGAFGASEVPIVDLPPLRRGSPAAGSADPGRQGDPAQVSSASGPSPSRSGTPSSATSPAGSMTARRTPTPRTCWHWPSSTAWPVSAGCCARWTCATGSDQN